MGTYRRMPGWKKKLSQCLSKNGWVTSSLWSGDVHRRMGFIYKFLEGKWTTVEVRSKHISHSQGG